MTKYSATDAAKNFGAVLAAAENEAVIVSRYGRPRAAVVGWGLYAYMKRACEEKAAAHLVKKLEAEIAAFGGGGASGEPVGAELKRLRAIRDMARELATPSD